MYKQSAVPHSVSCDCGLRLKCDGTRAETRFRLSAKRMSPFKSARGEGRRQFSRLLTAEVCASAVVMLDTPCSVVVWLTTPFASFPFTSPLLRHRVPSHFNWSLARVAGMFVTGSSLQFAAYNCSMGERIVLCIISPVIPGDVG